MTIELFSENSSVATRALQAYLVMIGLAWNRQVITYGDLSKNQMQHGDGGLLARPLGSVMGWCHENRLPPLTAVVVNKDTGVPGEGLVTIPDNNYPAAVELVFSFNWFRLFPPTIADLDAAGRRAQAGTLREPQ